MSNTWDPQGMETLPRIILTFNISGSRASVKQFLLIFWGLCHSDKSCSRPKLSTCSKREGFVFHLNGLSVAGERMPEIIILTKLNSFKKENQPRYSSCPVQMQCIFFSPKPLIRPVVRHFPSASQVLPAEPGGKACLQGPFPKLAFLVQVTCKEYFFLEK